MPENQQEERPSLIETEEEKLEVLRDAIVQFLIQVRSQYLNQEASTIKYLGQMQTRMKFAANVTKTVEQWCSEVCRKLKLSPSSALSDSMIELRNLVNTEFSNMELIDLINHETPLLIAMMQDEVEQAKEERRAKYEKNKV